jgi:hypothetical protein
MSLMCVPDTQTVNRSVCGLEEGQFEVTTGTQYPTLLLCWMYLLSTGSVDKEVEGEIIPMLN